MRTRLPGFLAERQWELASAVKQGNWGVFLRARDVDALRSASGAACTCIGRATGARWVRPCRWTELWCGLRAAESLPAVLLRAMAIDINQDIAGTPTYTCTPAAAAA